jgi:glucuronate isomerase
VSGFVDEDFLLETETARRLYHEVARDLPIIDFHCHLPVEQIARDHRFRSLTEIWLDGDHYKWRAMRANGVPERLVTGEASDWERFEAWARTVPATLRNPLYHWTHLELRNPFGVQGLLSPDTARTVFDTCNRRLAEEGFTTQGLLKRFRVALVATTDDPADTLAHHEALARRPGPDTVVVPTWRPDRALALDDPAGFNTWIGKLEEASRVSITRLGDLLDALERRHAAFDAVGCRASDHGLERLEAEPWDDAVVAGAFDRARRGEDPDPLALRQYRAFLLHHFAVMDHEKGWVQQYHLGALRNTNTRMRRLLGADTGLDSIGDFEMGRPLARFLDRLDEKGQLAKTILYNLNPRDNELFATMIGNFQDGSVPGKLQHGAAWWFLDQKDGMEAQLRALSNMGLLARFVGMITDSRSFLSYSRHEYFRRILCNLLGDDVRRGLVPDEPALLAGLVRDVCFANARSYFGFPLGRAAEGAK